MTAQARAYNVTGTGVVISGGCTYRGFFLNSGGAQTVTIYDGTSAAGTVLAQFTAAAAGEEYWESVPDGIRCDIGIFVNVSASTVAGSVRAG
jgi:hypothetical protein